MLIIRNAFIHHRMLLAVTSLVLALMLLFVGRALAAAGIWESYVVINGSYYDAKATTNLPNFSGADLGTHTAGTSSLILSGGEVKTYKNNGTDVQSTRLYYRVYESGNPTGSFTAVNLPWAQNLSNPGDQKWETLSANINLLNGLSAGNYTLEIYFDGTTNGVNQAVTIYENNNGNNYLATFTVTATPAPITVTDARAI